MSTLSTLKFRRGIFAAVLAFAPLSSASHAQDVGMLARVNVPFAFETETQHFAPGLYRIRMENEHTLLIQGATNSWLAMVRTEDNAQAEKTGKAVFHRYGNRYFLSGITVAGMSRKIHLVPSKAESEWKRTAPASVELALLQGSR